MPDLSPQHQAIADALAKRQGIMPFLDANPNGYGMDGPSQTDRFAPPQITPEMRSYEPTPGDRMADRFAQAVGPSNPAADRHHDAIKAFGDSQGMLGQFEMDAVTQPLHAMRAVSDAYKDPTLGNITNAGLQSANSIPTLGGMKTAGAILAGGYGAAAAQQMGLGPSSEASAGGLAPDQAARRDALRSKLSREGSLSKIERLELQGFADTETKDQQTQNELAAQKEAENTKLDAENKRSRMLVEQNAANSKIQQDAADAALERENRATAATTKQRDYTSAIARANTARDTELARNMPFEQTPVGKVYQATGGAPAMAGALAGGFGLLDRMAKGAPKTLNDYSRLALEGLGGASIGNNFKLASDAYSTPSDNPEKAAYNAYSRELPETDPSGAPTRKKEFKAYADSLPSTNEVHEQAQKELYDLRKFADRTGISAREGIPTAFPGANLPTAAKNVANKLAGMGKGGPPVDPNAIKPGILNQITDGLIGTPAYRKARTDFGKDALLPRQQLESGQQLSGRSQQQLSEADQLVPPAATRGASSSSQGEVSKGGPNPPAPLSEDQGQPLRPVPAENPLIPSPAFTKFLEDHNGPPPIPGTKTAQDPGEIIDELRSHGKVLSDSQSKIANALEAIGKNEIGPETRNWFQQVFDGLGGKKAPVASRDQLNIYNREVSGPGGAASPADAARSVLARYGNDLTPGKLGGPLSNAQLTREANTELQRLTGNPQAKGLADSSMTAKRTATYAAAQKLAEAEGIPIGKAVQKVLAADPVKGNDGLRRNVTGLSLAGATASQMGGSDADDDYQGKIKRALLSAFAN